MKINSSPFTFLFLWLIFFSSLGFSQEKKHMAWEVTSDKGETAYLVGSVHIVKPELYPLDDLYYNLLNKSDLVAFEVNLDSMMIESQALLPKYGLYPMGETLKDHLPEKTFKNLEEELEARCSTGDDVANETLDYREFLNRFATPPKRLFRRKYRSTFFH